MPQELEDPHNLILKMISLKMIDVVRKFLCDVNLESDGVLVTK